MTYFFKQILIVASSTIIATFGLISTESAQAFGSISGLSWNDINANGVKDSTEQVLSGWEIQLINQSGNIAQTTNTDLLGLYQFNNLDPGPYIVRQVSPAGWVQTNPNFNTSLINPQPVTGLWGYQGSVPPIYPPDQWGTIAPNANGNFQSPVNITGSSVNLNNWLNLNYQATELERVVNNGHSIEAEYAANSGNYLVINGQQFDLLQFHFHSDSEHTLNGNNYPMELHLVHRNATGGGITVLGLFLTQGAENQVLKPIFDNLSSLTQKGDEVLGTSIPNFNVADLLPTNSQGFFYQGSLTTPPATEGVNWFVFQNPIEVSSTQITAFQTVGANTNENPFYPGNRPIQVLNGRQFNELNYQVTLSDNTTIQSLNFGNSAVPEPSSVLGLLTVGGFLFTLTKGKI